MPFEKHFRDHLIQIRSFKKKERKEMKKFRIKTISFYFDFQLLPKQQVTRNVFY